MSEVEELPRVGRRPQAAPSAVRTAAAATAPWLPYVVAFLLSFAVYHQAARKIDRQGPTGDEPSYVLDAFSMARDGDRDLTNQFSAKQQPTLIKLFGIPIAPHGKRWTSAGYISWHGAGLGFVLVPAVWIGDSAGNPIEWMRYELMLISALAATLLLLLLRRVGSILGCRQLYVWATWVAVAGCLVLVSYSDRFYPEMMALLCTLAAIAAASSRRPGWKLLLAGAVAASFLPWLHIRFIPVCLGLLGVLLARGLGAIGEPGEPGRVLPRRAEIAAGWRAARSRPGIAAIAAVAVPAILSFAFMAFEFDRWYGSPSWTAMTVPGPAGNDAWYYNVVGGLFANDYGWLPFAPVFALALASIGCLWLLFPRWTTVGLIIAAGYHYVLGKSGLNTPGFAFPGRYEITCLPLLGMGLLVVLTRVRVAWLAFVPLLAVSLAITYQAAQHTGYLLINTGQVGLPLVAHLESAFPDVEPPALPTTFTADQKTTQAHTVGRVIGKKTHVAVATPSDGGGWLTAGPGVSLAPGVYIATFTVSQRGAHGGKPFAILQIAANGGAATLADRPLRAVDVPPGAARHIDVRFATPGNLAVETRALVNGTARVTLGNIDVRITDYAPVPNADTHPDAALMAAWAAGVFFVGALFVSIMRARRPPAPAPV